MANKTFSIPANSTSTLDLNVYGGRVENIHITAWHPKLTIYGGKLFILQGKVRLLMDLNSNQTTLFTLPGYYPLSDVNVIGVLSNDVYYPSESFFVPTFVTGDGNINFYHNGKAKQGMIVDLIGMYIR